MIIVSVSKFHVNLPWDFQPGEGPSRGLLRDYEPSDGPFWSTTDDPAAPRPAAIVKAPIERDGAAVLVIAWFRT